METEWSVPGWAVLATLVTLAVLVVALGVALVRSRNRARAELAAARADSTALAEQVAAIERRLDQPAPGPAREEHEYVVTMLGRDGPGGTDLDADDRAPAPVVPGPLFADLVLRESAVQAASLAAGFRRALAPETRHRIRWEMKREVKRARRQRRADVRQAKREVEARRRGTTTPEDRAA